MRGTSTSRKHASKHKLFRSIVETLEDRTLMAAPVDLLSNHGGGGITGNNSSETVLTPASVGSTQGGSSVSTNFGRVFDTTLDGQVYAQPLAVSNVNITRGNSQGIHNVIFVATMHDSLYAIDANTGTILWQDSFLNISNPTSLSPTTGVTTLPVVSGNNVLVNGSDIGPELGILSTPVVDKSTGLIYLNANTQEFRTTNGTTPANSGDRHFVQRLWAVKISDGTTSISVSNGPLEPTSPALVIGDTVKNSTISSSNYADYGYVTGPYVKGTGDNGAWSATGDAAPADGWDVNSTGVASVTGLGDATSPWAGSNPMKKGYVVFNALLQMNRVGMTELNGEIYLGFASHGDDGPYYGWILGYNATTLHNDIAWVSVPEFESFGTVSGDRSAYIAQAGFWNAGASIATDGTNLFISTGNGAFNPNTSNFSSTYVSDDNGNTVQMPLDGDYGDAVLKLQVDPNATQNNIAFNANGTSTFNNPNGQYTPDSGYNPGGFGLKVVDFFTPSNVFELNKGDSDIGSSGVMLIPSTGPGSATAPNGDPMLVTMGKEGRIYLIDADNLGGYNTQYFADENETTNNDPAPYDRVLGEYYYYEANVSSTTKANNATYKGYSIPGYFNGEFYIGLGGNSGSGTRYLPEIGFAVGSFPFSATPHTSVQPTPNFNTGNTTASPLFGGRGTTPTISSNGVTNGIVWNNNVTLSGTDFLIGYDTSGNVLFNSNWTIASGNDTLTNGVTNATGVKFSMPTAINGMVYDGTGGGSGTGGHIQGTLTGYGLLNPVLTAPSNLSAQIVTTSDIQLTWDRSASDNETVEKIERSTDGGNTWVVLAYVANGTTSYDDATVTNGNSYAYRVTAISGPSSGSPSNVTNVTVAPLSVTSSLFVWQSPPQSITFTFNQNVSAATIQSALQITNNTTSTTLTSAQFNVSFDNSTHTATVTFPGFSNGGALPNGNYTATLPAGLMATTGSTLASAYSFNFFFVNGDTDHSGTVDVTDLGVLSSHWQQASNQLYQFGDLNYDGTVNVTDLGILASNWQQGVATSAAPQMTPAPSAAPTRTPVRTAAAPGGTASSVSALVDSATKPVR